MMVMETTKERWFEAEVNRITGQIAFAVAGDQTQQKRKCISSAHSPSPAKQQAKSYELRAAMSLARLWRSQGKVSKRANCWLRFTGGLRRVSTRAI